MAVPAPLPAPKGFAFFFLNIKPQNELKPESSHGSRGQQPSCPAARFGSGTPGVNLPSYTLANAHHLHWGQIPEGVGNATGTPLKPQQREMLIEIKTSTDSSYVTHSLCLE